MTDDDYYHYIEQFDHDLSRWQTLFSEEDRVGYRDAILRMWSVVLEDSGNFGVGNNYDDPNLASGLSDLPSLSVIESGELLNMCKSERDVVSDGGPWNQSDWGIFLGLDMEDNTVRPEELVLSVLPIPTLIPIPAYTEKPDMYGLLKSDDPPLIPTSTNHQETCHTATDLVVMILLCGTIFALVIVLLQCKLLTE